MNTFTIYNANIITPTEVIEQASLQVEDGIITVINRDNVLPDNGNIIDAKGGLVMPGIIDIHTDALDAEIMPRPGANMPITVAFRELERKMSGCGFTTVYHSLHLGYDMAEAFSKSKYTRVEIFEQVYRSSQGQTLLDNKIHLRFELSGVAAYDDCWDLISKGYISLLSVMDHTPGQGQFNKDTYMQMAFSEGKTKEQALAEYREQTARPVIEGEKLQALIDHARANNIPVASHDDDTLTKVDEMYAMGIRICEFPINMETAEHATQLGMHVIGGASNILRGGSLNGNLNMADAIVAGAIDTLCSDYYPPAILHSIFRLHYQRGLTLPQAVNLASLYPAKAVKIDHLTGSIAPGKEADLLIVHTIDEIPMVSHTIVKGNIVSQASFKNIIEKLNPIF